MVDYRGGSQINPETEAGDSMEMTESGMEFPVVENLTASRIQKKMKKKA